jgi:aminoglycoside phosphotransferase (APT) family kinase protein
MSSPAPVSTLEEVTPAWLGEALAARFPGVRPVSIEVVDRSSGTTGRARLRVVYDDAHAGGPENVFVKLPPDDPAQQELVRLVGMGLRESRFYAEIAGELPVRLPRPYFATYNEDGTRYVMVLEDISVSRCSFPPVGGPRALDQARSVMDGMARLHAHLWNSPRFSADLSWIDPPPRHEFGATLVGQALERFATAMPAAFTTVGELYVERWSDLAELWDEGESTLVHGDPHLGNLFLDGDQMGFLDWAIIGRAPGLRDVSYFLANSLPVELRREREEELLRRYLDGLAAAEVEPPSFGLAWRRYCRLVVYSWVAAATTAAMGGKWQPEHIGQSALQRATTAVEDLDSAVVLREDLGA